MFSTPIDYRSTGAANPLTTTQGVMVLLKTMIIATSLALLLAALGCAGPPEIQEVEVTREVPVTQEVPVTVAVPQTVEVTRQVPVTQEVPVTVVVSETVEVTREVAVPQTVEVTREVPVTRVAVAMPTPAGSPTVSTADAPTATPPPTITPTVAPTPTPTPPETSHFHPWSMENKQYANLNKFVFQLDALDYEVGERAPTLNYECDHRGRRSMYIDWHDHPITAVSSYRPSASRDPFSEYRDIPHYALLEYTDGLLQFVDGLRLTLREQEDLDEIWDKVADRWFVGTGASHLAADPDPAMLVDQIRDRNHRSIHIDLDFHLESIVPDKWSKFGSPPQATITGYWVVLSDRTQINSGSLGELRMAIRELYAAPFDDQDKRPAMTATIKGPGQPVFTIAKWDITGIRQVMSHCKAIGF